MKRHSIVYQKSLVQGALYFFLMILTTLSLLNVSWFEKYTNIALLANCIVILFGFFCNIVIRKEALRYLVVVYFYLLISTIFSNGGLGSVLTFFISLLTIYAFERMQFSGRVKNFLIVVGVISIIILYFYSISYGENYYDYLRIKINPNTLGFFLMYFAMIIFIFCDEKKYLPFIILVFVLAFYGMFNYRSRGTTLALAVFLILNLFPLKVYQKGRFFWLVLLLIVIGTLFPVIYLKVFQSGYTIEIFGKPLYTGRETLWKNMFKLFDDNIFSWLLGLGSDTMLDGKDLNVHNNFFNIIVNFGLIGYALYYLSILSFIWRISKNMNNRVVKKSLLMFVSAVIVLGFTETTTLWAVVFPFAYFGLVLANSEKEKENCYLQQINNYKIEGLIKGDVEEDSLLLVW